MGHLLALCACCCYIIAGTVYVTRALHRRGGVLAHGAGVVPSIQFAWYAVLCGALCHTASLTLFMVGEQFLLFNNGADYLMWLGWMLSVGFLLSSRQSEYALIGAVVSPVLLFLLFSSSLLAHFGEGRPPLVSSSLFLVLHVVPVVIAEACLLLSGLTSLVFLVQEYRLRKKVATAQLLQGPGLSGLEAISRRFLKLGFAAISLAMLSGACGSSLRGVTPIELNIVQLSGFFSWLCIAYLLHLHLTERISMKRASQANLLIAVGAVIVIAALRVFVGLPLHGGSSSV